MMKEEMNGESKVFIFHIALVLVGGKQKKSMMGKSTLAKFNLFDYNCIVSATCSA